MDLSDVDSILDQNYELSKYIQIKKYLKTQDTILLYNWITYLDYELPIKWKDFFEDYDNKKTLKHNLDKKGIDIFAAKNTIKMLIEWKVLMLSCDYEKYLDNE